MQKYFGLIVLAALAICQVNATEISLETSEDEKSIRQVAETLMSAWRDCNSELAVQVFSEDADWMNAFGVKKKGREK